VVTILQATFSTATGSWLTYVSGCRQYSDWQLADLRIRLPRVQRLAVG